MIRLKSNPVKNCTVNLNVVKICCYFKKIIYYLLYFIKKTLYYSVIAGKCPYTIYLALKSRSLDAQRPLLACED